MKREINWPYFSRLACPGCTEVRRAGGSDPCEVHEEMGALFVRGFEQAARLAVVVESRPCLNSSWGSVTGWMLVVPGMSERDRTWGATGLMHATREQALASIDQSPPWWPLQPWELEVSDDAVR